ncbi:MAG TPA: hypothetical protein VFI49_07895 [Rudaea sp.]|nr:hypothetical protein [Rudaea sp.]
MLVIPAKAGLRRQDAEANIRAANGPKGEPRMRRVIQPLLFMATETKLDSGFRRNDELGDPARRVFNP